MINSNFFLSIQAILKLGMTHSRELARKGTGGIFPYSSEAGVGLAGEFSIPSDK